MATPATPTPAAAAAMPKPATPATTPRFTLDDQGRWIETSKPVEGSDAAVIAEARRLLADDQPGQAEKLLDGFIDRNENTSNALLAQAYLLRGDAITAGGNEYKALYDYETVIKSYAATPEFVTAVERELDIAVRYVTGTKRKWLGMRFASAEDEGEELLIRVQERLPGSRLAERAGIELADHYYRQRELNLAGEAYELFLANFPNSPYRNKAMQRRIYSNIGRFKGPRYDGSSLVDASVLIRRYMSLYPAQANAAGLDQALLNRIDESAAQQLSEVGDWYIYRGDLVSGRATLQRLVRLHSQSAAAGRAIRELESRGWPLKHEPAMLAMPIDEIAAINPSEDDAQRAKKPGKPDAAPASAPTSAPVGAKK